jgi:PAS domain S-box-containing protein
MRGARSKPKKGRSGQDKPFAGGVDVLCKKAEQVQSELDTPYRLAESSTVGRVLVVDDEVEMLKFLAEALPEFGYEITCSETASEALEALKQQDFDLLLTDMKLPGMDGIELIRAALEIDQNLVGIVITAYASLETAVEAMRSGAFDYVTKPFDLARLSGTLSRAMEVHRLRLENIHLREMMAIYYLAQAAAFPLDDNAFLNQASAAILRQCQGDEVSIMLATPDGRALHMAAAKGKHLEQFVGARVPIEEGVAGWVARNRQSVMLSGTVDDSRFKPINPRPDIHAALSMPMMAAGNFVGVINVNVIHNRRPFSPAAVKALTIMVGMLASILHGSRLFGDLRAAEEKYRSIFENAIEGIFQTTPDGRIIGANPALARMYGYDSPEELMEDIKDVRMQQYVNPADRDRLLELLETQGVAKRFETQARKRNGDIFWVSINSRPMKDGDGQILYYEGTVEDITERKRAEEALRASEERVTKAFRSIPEGLVISRLEDGKIVEVNNSWHKVFGYSREEAIGKSSLALNLFADPADRQRAIALLREQGFVRDFELRIRQKLGALHTGILSIELQEIQGEQYLLTVVQDITERKRAEEALRVSEEKYRSIFENAIEGIFQTTPEGKYLSVNPAFARMYGYDSPEELMEDIQDIRRQQYVNPGDRDRIIELFETQGSVERFEKQSRKKNGDIFWISITGRSVRNGDGQTLYYEGTVEDITERKKAEETLRESEERVKVKLNALLSPEGDIGTLELSDIIDVQRIRKLMDDFFKLTNIPLYILDRNGKILVATGWQDICTKFHRVHPETCKNCIESDTILSMGVAPGTFKVYRCKNNMWDLVTPITVAGSHIGNLFLGQFFFEDESMDYDIFRAQAQKYGFDEEEYIAALERVPRWSREAVDTVMNFYTNFAHMLATLSYGNIKLARTLTERNELLTTLRESEEKYRSIFENAIEGIFQTTPDGRIIGANPALARMYGYDSPEELMEDIKDLRRQQYANPGDRDRILELYETQGFVERFETQSRKKNGDIVWVSINARIVRDGDGHTLFYEGTIEDITERKKAQEALRLSEEYFRRTFDEAPIGAAVISPEGYYQRANRIFCQITGYTEGELTSLRFVDITHPDDREEDVNQARRLLAGEIGRHEMDKRWVRKDGTICWIHGSVRMIRDPEGRPLHYLPMIQDITDRKKAEHSLRLSEEKYRSIFDNAIEGIWRTTPDGKYLEANPALARMYGYDSPEELMENIKDLRLQHYVNPAARDRFKRLLAKEGVVRDFESLIRKKDGEPVWMSLNARAVKDSDGQILFYEGTTVDISRRKKAEMLRKETGDRLRRQSEHLRTLSKRLSEVHEEERRSLAQELHDRVGGNLTALGIDLNILKRQFPEALQPAARSYLDDALSLLTETIDHIRDVMSDLRPAVLDDYGLPAALRWYSDRFSSRTGIKVTLAGSDFRLDASMETALFRIAQEASTNVAKHAQASHVEVKWERREGKVSLEISDNGVGLPHSKADRDDTAENWGVLIMKERAAAVGGHCTISSGPEGGTRVGVEIAV